MQEKQFVQDLKDRQSVASIFMVADKSVLVDRNGKRYMSLNLIDATGSINARIWENVDELAHGFESGDFVQIKGHVQTYQNRRQVIVHDIQKAGKESVKMKDFVSSDIPEPEAMFQSLMTIVSKVQRPHLRQLLENTLSDTSTRERLLRSPAAKSIHHAYMGGLLEHILSICQTMEFLAGHYKYLDRDLLIFGAIFHDLGKIWELTIEDGIKYTDRGRLVGHMAIACEMIDEQIRKIPDFPTDLPDLLKHIILSHHGKLEFGSPKVPQIPEAMVVAMIDDLDSKLNTVFQFMRSELSAGDRWTRLNAHFERYFYLDVLREKTQEAE